MRRSRMRSYTALVDCGAGTGRYTLGSQPLPLPQERSIPPPIPGTPLQRCNPHPPSRDSPEGAGSPPGRHMDHTFRDSVHTVCA